MAHQSNQVVDRLRLGERLVAAFMRQHPHPGHLRALHEPVQGPQQEARPRGDGPVADEGCEVPERGDEDEVGREVVRGGGEASLEAVPRDRLLYVGKFERRPRQR